MLLPVLISWMQAVRGCVLDGDAGAAARGVFDGLLGLVVEVVVLQAATGRSQGVMGALKHPSDRRTWPRSTRRTIEGSIARECGRWCRRLGGRLGEGPR